MLDPNDDLTQPNSAQADGEANQEGQQQEQGQQEQSATIDWDADDNPYKKRYGDSQGQIQPLVRTLNQFAEYDHNTKSWKPKGQQNQQQTQQSPSDFEKALEGYDPEFVKNLKGIITPLQSRLEKFEKEQEQSAFMNNYNSSMTAARNKTLQEFGTEFDLAKNGKFNDQSPLYKMANEILTAKYAQFNPDGSFHRYTSPDAEYMATVEAYAIMAKRSKQAPVVDKGKLGAIQGKGTKSSGVKKALSYEEYSKLSNSEKDAYDMQQAG